MLICTPIQCRRQKEVIQQLNQLKGKADIAEIWLDHIADLNLKALLKNPPLPVLCVCKKSLDKGLFKGSYAKQAEILIEAIKNGADYIDIPLKMPAKLTQKILRSKVKGQRSKVIISYHNFKKTLSKAALLKKALEMKKRGADIVKIAVKGESLQDSLDMIFLAKELQTRGIKHILITMGGQGALTRIVTPFLGGTLMFAPLKTSQLTAPGQLTVKELKEAWGLIGLSSSF